MKSFTTFNSVFGGIAVAYVLCNATAYYVGMASGNEVLLFARHVATVPSITIVELLPMEKVGSCVHVWHIVAAVGNGILLYLVAWIFWLFSK